MVLEPEQLFEGLRSGGKPPVSLGMWDKFPAPLWAPGIGVGSHKEALIPAVSPSRGTTTYSVLESGGEV